VPKITHIVYQVLMVTLHLLLLFSLTIFYAKHRLCWNHRYR